MFDYRTLIRRHTPQHQIHYRLKNQRTAWVLAGADSVEVLRGVAERAGLAGVGRVFPAVGMSGYNPVFAGLFVVTNL
ncbi:hypothetical protein [Pseudomonas salomonii]|uniref:hypothetical protein n=1 Tax=Pseudomonas salomonii TaxID=191391 RepID=UPI00114D261F|nr:hypothetical protein [Pseudomonas salomonii]